MLAFVSIPFVRVGILTDVTADLRAICPAKLLGKFAHMGNLDFERERPFLAGREQGRASRASQGDGATLVGNEYSAGSC
jgi:hypothetical protein